MVPIWLEEGGRVDGRGDSCAALDMVCSRAHGIQRNRCGHTETDMGLKGEVSASDVTVWGNLQTLIVFLAMEEKRRESRDFPGGPVVRALSFHCRGHGFYP